MRLVQLPEGLKHRFLEFVERDDWLVLDPCYGACDVRWEYAKKLQVKKIVHYGHEKLVDVPTEVEYIPLDFDIDFNAVKEALDGIKERKTVYTVPQYKKWGEKIRQIHGVVDFKAVLGCRVERGKGDVNVFLGDGTFHAIQIRRVTGKRTFVLFPNGKIMDIEEIYREKEAEREKVKAMAVHAKRWGVVVSVKAGQFNIEKALEVKEMLEKSGKEVFLFVCDYFFPEYVLGMPIDAFVFTGCPRVPLDDWKLFKKPVLTPEEVISWLRLKKKN